jgi:hypothetical protein
MQKVNFWKYLLMVVGWFKVQESIHNPVFGLRRILMERYSKFMKICFLAFLVILLSFAGDAQGGGVKIYRILPKNFNQGQIMKVNNKEYKVIEINPDDLMESVQIISRNNENTQYWVRIKTWPFPEKEFHGGVLDVNGFTIRDSGWGGHQENVVSISFYPVDKKIASIVASGFNVELENREHPGHKLLTRFTKQDKDNLVTLEITNVGDKSVTFMDGGMQRGFRNNQFGFIGFRNNRAMKDVGSPSHLGGLAWMVTLKPGEKFTKEVDLSKWFDLSEKGHYEVAGLFYLEFYPESKADVSASYHRVIWEDYAVAKFTFTIE